MSRDYNSSTRICIDCGEIITGCGCTKLRCQACAREKIREDKRKNARRYYHAKSSAAPPKKKKRLTIDEMIKAANQAGMSYGMYQAMIYEQEGKH